MNNQFVPVLANEYILFQPICDAFKRNPLTTDIIFEQITKFVIVQMNKLHAYSLVLHQSNLKG